MALSVEGRRVGGDDAPWDLRRQFTDLAAAKIIELSLQALHETRKLMKGGCGEAR